MSDIKTWSTAAASNDMAVPDGAPEGWNSANVNNWGRETMAAVRRWYDQAEWLDFGHTPSYSNATTFSVPTDQTAKYVARRRFRADDGGSLLYGEVVSSTYSAPNTSIVVAMDGAGLTSSLTGVALAILTPGQGEPIVRSVSAMFVSTTLSVSGAAKIGGDLSVGGTTNLQALSISGSLNVGTQATIGTTLTVNGAFTAADTAAISGDASIGGNLKVTGDIETPGRISASGTVNATQLQLSGDASIGGALAVTGNIDANKVSASGMNALALSVSSAVVNSNMLISGALTVSGAARAGSMVTAGTISAGSSVRGAQLFTDGSGSFGGAVRVTGDLEGSGKLSASATVIAASFQTAGDISASGTVTGAAGKFDSIANSSAEERFNPNLGTAQATTSGTAFDFTSLPSWVTKIRVVFAGVSLSGNDDILVQLGTSGGFVTSGYTSQSGNCGVNTNATSSSSGMIILVSAADTCSGYMDLCLIDGTEWISSHATKISTQNGAAGGGDVDAGGVVTQIRVTRSGSNTFDAGKVNIIYE